MPGTEKKDLPGLGSGVQNKRYHSKKERGRVLSVQAYIKTCSREEISSVSGYIHWLGITPDGVIPSGKKKLDISSAEVREFGYSKALKDLCPETWKKPLGDEWMDVLLHIISTWSCKSYLLRDKPLKDEKELHCSLNSQFGLLSRKFYKKYGVAIETLKELEDIYMDGHEIISRISEKQETVIKLFNLKLEVD